MIKGTISILKKEEFWDGRNEVICTISGLGFEDASFVKFENLHKSMFDKIIDCSTREGKLNKYTLTLEKND